MGERLRDLIALIGALGLLVLAVLLFVLRTAPTQTR
jgi:hypothetical protein